MVTTENNLDASHQEFIDNLQELVSSAKEKLIKEFTSDFDVEEVLTNPDYGKELMAELQNKLAYYLYEAQEVGNKFGKAKEDFYNASS